MLSNFFFDAEDKIKKSVDFLKNEFIKISINKLNINLIRNLVVSINGEKMVLQHIAVINVEVGNFVLIKPFDKRHTTAICNDIVKLNMDLNPFAINESIKVTFPAFTMERRQLFLKKAKQISDDTKISIRNVRKNINHDVKNFLKSNKISSDEEKKFFSDLQKLIDSNIDVIDNLMKKKEQELLNV